MPNYLTIFSSCNKPDVKLPGSSGAVQGADPALILIEQTSALSSKTQLLLSQSSTDRYITLTCSWTLIACIHIYNIIKPTHKHFLNICYLSVTVLQFVSTLCTCKSSLVLHHLTSYRWQRSQENRGEKRAGWNKGVNQEYFQRLMESLLLQQIYNRENELSAFPATAKPDCLK